MDAQAGSLDNMLHLTNPKAPQAILNPSNGTVVSASRKVS